MLTELLDPDAIVLHYPAQDAEDVIRLLSQKLLDKGYVRESFADATLAREAKLPTGLALGGNIHAAIPHTDVEHVIKPAVALATLSQSVTFQHMIAPDEKVEVQIVFLLALEQPKTQVTMLQEVASVLQDQALIQRLMSADTPKQILAALDQASHKTSKTSF